MFRLTCWVCCTVLRQATRISGGCSPGSTSKLLHWYLGTWVCLGTFSHPGHLNLVGEPVPDPVPVTLHHDEVHLALIEIIIVLLKQCQCEAQVEVPSNVQADPVLKQCDLRVYTNSVRARARIQILSLEKVTSHGGIHTPHCLQRYQKASKMAHMSSCTGFTESSVRCLSCVNACQFLRGYVSRNH